MVPFWGVPDSDPEMGGKPAAGQPHGDRDRVRARREAGRDRVRRAVARRAQRHDRPAAGQRRRAGDTQKTPGDGTTRGTSWGK